MPKLKSILQLKFLLFAWIIVGNLEGSAALSGRRNPVNYGSIVDMLKELQRDVNQKGKCRVLRTYYNTVIKFGPTVSAGLNSNDASAIDRLRIEYAALVDAHKNVFPEGLALVDQSKQNQTGLQYLLIRCLIANVQLEKLVRENSQDATDNPSAPNTVYAVDNNGNVTLTDMELPGAVNNPKVLGHIVIHCIESAPIAVFTELISHPNFDQKTIRVTNLLYSFVNPDLLTGSLNTIANTFYSATMTHLNNIMSKMNDINNTMQNNSAKLSEFVKLSNASNKTKAHLSNLKTQLTNIPNYNVGNFAIVIRFEGAATVHIGIIPLWECLPNQILEQFNGNGLLVGNPDISISNNTNKSIIQDTASRLGMNQFMQLQPQRRSSPWEFS